MTRSLRQLALLLLATAHASGCDNSGEFGGSTLPGFWNPDGSRPDAGVDDGGCTDCDAGLPPTFSTLSLGDKQSCASTEEGHIWCWGSDEYGLIRLTGSGERLLAPQPSGNATGITVGISHGCGQRAGQTLCWGNNEQGQAGHGEKRPAAQATRVPGIEGVAQSAVGNASSCAIADPDGQLYCWGKKVGDTATAETPKEVLSWNRVETVSLGFDHACLLRQGQVACWGDGRNGRLGLNDERLRYTPTPLVGVTNVRALALGEAHSCALRRSNDQRDSVLCWGDNEYNQTGEVRRTIDTLVPLNVRMPTDEIDEIASHPNARHTCIRSTKGKVHCWGDNRQGQLGDGTTTTSFSPTEAKLPLAATDIAVGGRHTCALLQDASVYCWGDNNHNQQGTLCHDLGCTAGTDEQNETPTAVPGLK